MIDPKNITNYNLTHADLEEHILFWVCAAGKNGVTAAKCLDYLLNWALLHEVVMKSEVSLDFADKRMSPFDKIKLTDENTLAEAMKRSGIGCYTRKAFTFKSLAYNFNTGLISGKNLKTCTVEDLEGIKGIGPKTARCFIMHSRPNQRLAGLDVHVLRYLRDKGYKVPKTTPSSGKAYKRIEQYFLNEADKAGKNPADFDLEIWNEYRERK